MRKGLFSTFIGWLLLVLVAGNVYGSPSVTSVEASQIQDSTRNVKIVYTLNDPESSFVHVTVSISTDNGATYSIDPSLATGDIGWVRPGGSRTIVWDAKSQYPQGKWLFCKAKVTADNTIGGIYPGEMIYIPAGSFLMGNSGVGNDATYGYLDEYPQHSVYLSGYYIGKYEVTRGEYRAFMNAGGYSNSSYWSSAGWSWKRNTSRTQPDYWDASQNWGTPPGSFTQEDSYPVVGISYYEAEAFCSWAGGHLPTEAQWEKAARWNASTNHPNVYPWGDTWDAEKCNNWYDHSIMGGGYESHKTAPVGSYPAGASPYGCQDMAGNEWEWCKDRYNYKYYSQTPASGWKDPQGPTSGNFEWVIRGGAWGGDARSRCAYRASTSSNSGLGFRLAR